MNFGRIKWFNNQKGYGFISFKANEDIFVYKDSLDVLEGLEKGQLVSFDIVETVRGYQALNVKAIENSNKIIKDILEKNKTF